LVPRRTAAGELAQLREDLCLFSAREITGHAELALTAAWCELLAGLPADHWLAAAERGRYDAAAGDEAAVTAALALLRAVLGRSGVTLMRADARLALGLLPPGDPWRATALFMLAQYLRLAGWRDEAPAAFRAAEEEAAQSGAAAWQAAALGE